MNPANNNAAQILKDLNIDTKEILSEVIVSIAVLDTYVGKYELAPNFIITITRKENSLFAQATAQPQFEIFASAQNKFYFKVVEANLVFNSDEEGKIKSVTLNQGGQSPEANKIE